MNYHVSPQALPHSSIRRPNQHAMKPLALLPYPLGHARPRLSWDPCPGYRMYVCSSLSRVSILR